MLAASVTGIVEHRRWRTRAAERLIVGDIDPTSRDISLADGEDGDRGVIAVEPLGREDVALQRSQNRS